MPWKIRHLHQYRESQIGKYATENGTTRAIRFFSQHWKRNISEATVRHLKDEYLQLDKQKDTGKPVESLPTKPQGRPYLVGAELDQAIKDYLLSLSTAGGVVNTAITFAAAEGIITARYPGKLQKQGGDFFIGKDWAESLLKCMGFVKRKVSNGGKVLVAEFEELKEQFIADIAAEVIMKDIPPDLIINWDQTWT